MRGLEPESVHAIVCDPPYGLEFMGKEWDKFRIDEASPRNRGERAGNHGEAGPGDGSNPARGKRVAVAYGGGKRPSTFRCMECGKRDQFRNEHCCTTGWRRELIDPFCAPPTMLAFQNWCNRWAREALRVLKPGGHLLAFGGTRTYHRLTCALEDAGFEIRDCLAWLYGTGFPKSHNLEDEHLGWGTALKPAHEPVVVARKPLTGTVAATMQEHGTGALHVDACRIGFRDEADEEEAKTKNRHAERDAGPRTNQVFGADDRDREDYDATGRWPANVVVDEAAAQVIDDDVGEVGGGFGARRGDPAGRGIYGRGFPRGDMAGVGYGDSGGASRFFYCAKASSAERVAGLDDLPVHDREGDSAWAARCEECGRTLLSGERKSSPCCGAKAVWETTKPTTNHHPTVKPVALMRWLVRLVTPEGGTVLDPFLGSGTTGIAASIEGFRFVGIEQDPDFLDIARARIKHWRRFVDDPAKAVAKKAPEPTSQGRLFE